MARKQKVKKETHGSRKRKPAQAPIKYQGYEEEEEYVIEKIIDMKEINGQIHYFVKWEGYPDSENTWEPYAHLINVEEMVLNFEDEYFSKHQEEIEKFQVTEEEQVVVAAESEEQLQVEEGQKIVEEEVEETEEKIKEKKDAEEEVDTEGEKDEDEDQHEGKMDIENKNERPKIENNLDLFAEDGNRLKFRDLNNEEEGLFKKRKTSVTSSRFSSQNQEIEFINSSINQENIILTSDYDFSGAKIAVTGYLVSQDDERRRKSKRRKGTKSLGEDSSSKTVESSFSEREKENDPNSGFKLFKNPLEENPSIRKTKITFEKNDEKKSITDYSFQTSNRETPKMSPQQVMERVNEIEKTEEVKLDMEERFEFEDKPKCILSIKRRRNGFWFLVQWEKREDGTQPKDSYLTNDELKIHAPKFLAEFYESKIIMMAKKRDNNAQVDEKDENKDSKTLYLEEKESENESQIIKKRVVGLPSVNKDKRGRLS